MNDYITRKIKSKNKEKYNYEYFDKRKNKLNKKSINKYLKDVYIPPAYNNVKINKNKSAKILAIGIDEKGRSQYTYNKKTIKKNSKSKFKKLIDFGKNHSKLIKKINSDLNGPFNKDKLISLILKLIINCNFRVGNEKYTCDNKSYGVSTLEKKHLKFIKDKLIINFIGKKGVKNICNVNDKKIINYLKILYKNSKSGKIFTYTEDGKTKNIKSSDVNNYLKNLGNYTTKNFRTWNANIELIKNINKCKSNDNILKKCIENVAKKLHHTASVCKKNYIDPKLIKLFETNSKLFYKQFKNGNVNKNYTEFLIKNY